MSAIPTRPTMTLTIRDGIGHVAEEYTIEDGRILDVPSYATAACLADLDLSGMSAEQAQEAIWDAYAGPGSGYDGDPVENGLSIRVERE